MVWLLIEKVIPVPAFALAWPMANRNVGLAKLPAPSPPVLTTQVVPAHCACAPCGIAAVSATTLAPASHSALRCSRS